MLFFFFFSSRRRHTRSVSAFLLNRSSDLYSSRISLRGRSAASLRQNCVTVFSFSKNHFSSPSGRWSIVLLISSWGSILSFISGRLATKSNQIKQLIRNGRSASLQRTFKKSFTSFSH